MKRLAIAFTGPSNSGKTTLVVKLTNYLQDQGYKVVIIKHDPQDKAIFDKEGKDSYKFSQTGADVAVMSPNKTTLFKQTPSQIEEIINMFVDFDYLLVEGLKTIPLPRICVARNELNDKYFDVSDAIATDDSIEKDTIPNTMTTLDLNDIQSIAMWIENNAKRV